MTTLQERDLHVLLSLFTAGTSKAWTDQISMHLQLDSWARCRRFSHDMEQLTELKLTFPATGETYFKHGLPSAISLLRGLKNLSVKNAGNPRSACI